MLKSIVFSVAVCLTFISSAQSNIKGIITDSLTHEAMPFVNVVSLHTGIGSVTNFDGEFKLSSILNEDSIKVSYVGYKTKVLPVSLFLESDSTNVPMSSSTLLKTIEVVAGKNPAFKLLKKINDHKEENRPSSLAAYEYKSYAKVLFSANNLDQDFEDKAYLKKLNFINDYVDTTNGQKKLPFLLMETISKVYVRSNPNNQKEEVLGTNITGVDNLNLTQLTADINKEINLYDNNFTLFGSDFLSPIAPTGRAFYKYLKVDDDTLNGVICHHLKFEPKRQGDALYKGDVWVDEISFAVVKFSAMIPQSVNLNYVSNFKIEQSYKKVDSAGFLFDNSELTAEFTLLNDLKKKDNLSLSIRKTSKRTNQVVNKPYRNEFYLGDVVTSDSADARSNEFWNEVREGELSNTEQGVVQMVDSLKGNKTFQLYDKLLKFGTTGFVSAGKVEVGYLYSLYVKTP